jgi:hypothetical protein
MTEIAVLPQKMVDIKTSVLKSRLDSRMARNLGEQLKRRFFRNFGFLKPDAQDVQLVGFEKYYEPYLVIGGIYSIDYCRQHICKVKVEENTKEIFVGGKKFRSELSSKGDQSTRIVKLEGEEVVHYERETYFILDRFRREVSPEEFSLAPYEDQVDSPKYADMSFRKCDNSTEADIEFLSAKIAHRPRDAAEVMREMFEITERTIIYRPVYELTFQDLKTAKEATLQIDGVSSKMALMRYRQKDKRKLSEQTVSFRPDFSANQIPSRQSEPQLKPLNKSREEKREVEQQSPIVDSAQISKESSPQKEEIPDFPADIKAEVFTVGDNVTAVIGDLEIPSGTNITELLVVKGTLKIGDRCRLSRKLKALGDIIIGSETVIEDSLVSGGNVVIGAGSVIHGSIKAAGRIEFREKVIEEKETLDSSVESKETVELGVVVEPGKDESVISCRD